MYKMGDGLPTPGSLSSNLFDISERLRYTALSIEEIAETPSYSELIAIRPILSEICESLQDLIFDSYVKAPGAYEPDGIADLLKQEKEEDEEDEIDLEAPHPFANPALLKIVRRPAYDWKLDMRPYDIP